MRSSEENETEMKSEMTPRERVRTALMHREPDRLPLDFGGTFLSSAEKEMQARIADVLGLTGEPDRRFVEFDDRIQKHFGCDMRSIRPTGPGMRFGYSDVHDAPLKDATVDDLNDYPWPEAGDELIEGVEETARFLHEETDYFICSAQVGEGIFELGCILRGYEQFLVDLMIDREFFHAFARKVVDANIRLGDLYFGVVGPYVDMVLIGDDLATQNGPYMSPQVFRETIKPYFQEYIASVKRLCPNAFINHHCCGSSFRLMDDLADIGIDVINPVQTSAREMDPENLATKKDKLSFHGGGDLQYILPFGTTDEVEEFTKDLIRKLAPGGGFILAPGHSLPDDVKPENVVALLEAGRRWGGYPIVL